MGGGRASLRELRVADAERGAHGWQQRLERLPRGSQIAPPGGGLCERQPRAEHRQLLDAARLLLLDGERVLQQVAALPVAGDGALGVCVARGAVVHPKR